MPIGTFSNTNSTSNVVTGHLPLYASPNNKIWVEDKEEGYLDAQLVIASQDGFNQIKEHEQSEDMVMVQYADLTTKLISRNSIQLMNPPKYQFASDLADLTYLNEGSVLHNLKHRYINNTIYTYSGLFLVAINPYKWLPIYTENDIQMYRNKKRSECSPHIYAIADRAYHQMMKHDEDQSILITGESGAGKTENTKKVIQYIAAIASGQNSSQGVSDLLDIQILSANPILEAFGNAQTIKNNNSSRFGKFIRLEFNNHGVLSGANIERYLLEKSRVTHQNSKERNFHIFYQFLKGAPKILKDKLHIYGTLDDYEYVKHSRKDVEGIDDVDDFNRLIQSMKTMSFTEKETEQFFMIIAVILHLGNIQIKDDRDGQAKLAGDENSINYACSLLQVPTDHFVEALLRPQLRAGRELIIQGRNAEQVKDSIETTCRALYDRMFGILVNRINQTLDKPMMKHHFIGVLDIAGFEIFENNSFEQLCINYTNEKLQQFFNHHMFILEQEEYQKERVDWQFVDFGLDLQSTIDLIEKSNPIGVLALLDEDCVMPKATDRSFTEKLHSIWGKGKSDKYDVPRYAPSGFHLVHYAGKVEYHTEGWLDKNKDPVNENLASLIARSQDSFVSELFQDWFDDSHQSSQAKRSCSGGSFRTVSQKYKEQLSYLISQLNKTQPHFVRCILPNEFKKPGKINSRLVLDQLKCNGVLEGIRICRQGYPNRISFPIFRQRYELLALKSLDSLNTTDYLDGAKAVDHILKQCSFIDRMQFKIGLTKVFFRAGTLGILEQAREDKIGEIIREFQIACQAFMARRRYKRRFTLSRAVTIIQKNARVYIELKEWPWWKLWTKLRPLLNITRIDKEMKEREHQAREWEEKYNEECAKREGLEKQAVLIQQDRKSLEMELAYEREALKDNQDVLAGIRCRLNQLEDEMEHKNTSMKQFEERSTLLVQEKQLIQESLFILTKQHESLNHLYESLTKERDRLQENLSIQEKSNSLECARLQSLLIKAQTDLNNGNENISNIQASLAQRVHDYELLMEKYNHESNTKDQIIQEKQSLSQQIIQLKTERDSYQERITSLVGDFENKSKELNILIKKYDHLESDHNLIHDQYIETDRLYKESMEHIEIFQFNLNQEKNLRQSKEAELKELVQILNQKEGELGVQQDKMKQLREHEITSLENQINQLQELLDSRSQMGKEEVDKLKNRVKSFEHEVEHQKRTIINQESILEETKQAWQNEIQSKKILEQQKRQICTEYDQLFNTLTEKDRQLTLNSQQVQSLEKKIQQMNSQKTSMIEQLDTLERQAQTLTSTIHQQSSDLDFYKERLLLLEESKKKWLQDVKDLTTQLNEESNSKKELQTTCSSKLGSLEEKICQQLLDIENTNVQLEASKRELSLLKSDLVQHQNTIQILEKTKSRQAGELQDSKLELERIQVYCNTLERQIKLQEIKIVTLSNDSEDKKKQVDMFEQEIKKIRSKYTLELEEKQLQLDLLTKSRDALEREHKTLTLLMTSQEDLNSGTNSIELDRLKQEMSKLQEILITLQEEKEVCLIEKKQLEQVIQNIQRIHEQDLHDKSIQMEEQKKTLFKEIQDLRSKLESETTNRLEIIKTKKKLESELGNLSNSLNNERLELEKKVQKGSNQLKDLQAKLVTEECLRRTLEETNSRNDKKISEIQHQLELARTMHQVADQGKQIMEDRVAKLDEEIQILMDEKNSLSDEKKQLEKRASRMESEFNEKVTALTEDNQREFAQTEQFKLKLQEELNSAMNTLKSVREEVAQLESTHDNEIKSLQLELDNVQKRYISDISRYEQQIQTCKNQLEDQERVISLLDDQNVNERNQALDQVNTKQIEIDKLENEQESLKATISDLLHQIEEYQLSSELEKEKQRLNYEKLKTELLEGHQEKDQELRFNISELEKLTKGLNQELLQEKNRLHQLDLEQKKLKQVNIEQEIATRKHSEQFLIAKKEKDMLSNQVEILQLSLKESRFKQENAIERNSRTENTYQQLLQQFNDLERSHRQILESFELKDGKLNELLTENHTLMLERGKLNQELGDIQQEHESLKEILEQQKEIMDERQSRLNLIDEQLANAHKQLQEEQLHSYDLLCKTTNLEHSLREYHHANVASAVDISLVEDDAQNNRSSAEYDSSLASINNGHKQLHTRPASTLSSSSINNPSTFHQSSMKQQFQELYGLLQTMIQEKSLLSKDVKAHEKSIREMNLKLQDKEKHLKRSLKECEILREKLQNMNCHSSSLKLVPHYRLSSPTNNQNDIIMMNAPQATRSCQVTNSMNSSICDQDHLQSNTEIL